MQATNQPTHQAGHLEVRKKREKRRRRKEKEENEKKREKKKKYPQDLPLFYISG